MYSMEPIDLVDLSNKNLYDQDHIYPKSKIYDDSIENRVLVKKQLNAIKSNSYPISDKVIDASKRAKVERFWKLLHDKGLIGDKKYSRLVRKTPFTEEELAGFLARQLVETRQATKETANLLQRFSPKSRIVYVKADNVSDFRRNYNILKSRSVSDLHHAHDAYLNIVVGNVFDTKFTQNPYRYIKNENRKESYNLVKIYEYDIKRNNEIAWIAPDRYDKNKSTLKTIKANIRKTDIRNTRRMFISKGALFDQTIQRKGKGQAPIKENSLKSDINKYGGYNKLSIAYFCLVEDKDKNKSIEAIPIMLANKSQGEADIIKYLENTLKVKGPKILIDRIKINSLFKINGFYYHLKGKTNDRLVMDGAVQLLVDNSTIGYIKAIERVKEKLLNDKEYSVNKYDRVNFDDNMKLYDTYLKKLNESIYQYKGNNKKDEINNLRHVFEHLSLEEQVKVLGQLLMIFGSYNSGINLELLGLAKKSCVNYMSKNLKYTECKLISQSITGLFETEEDLLKL